MRDFGEECVYGNFECPRGASCFPNGVGKGGTCRCESFFGFHGATCDELSAASWLLFALTLASMAFFVYATGVNVVLLWQLKRAGLLKQDSVGRTLLFGFLLPCPLLGLDIGIMVTLFGVDKSRLYDHHLRVPLIVSTQFLFVAGTLSVSTVWLEMANKAKAGRTAVAPLSAPSMRFGSFASSKSSSTQRIDSRNDNSATLKKLPCSKKCATAWLRREPQERDINGRGGGYDPYRATLYGTAWGTSIAMLIFLITLADPLVGSLVLFVVMALVGASFLIAGNRIYRTLLRRPMVAPAPPSISIAPAPAAPASELALALSTSQLPTSSPSLTPAPSEQAVSSSSPPPLSSFVDLRCQNHSSVGTSTCSDDDHKSGSRTPATLIIPTKGAGAPPPAASNSLLEPSVYAMALHVQRTARGVGARCVTVALLGFLYGLSRPSPTPVYKEQNSLPPLLSGQVPYFLFTVTIMNTSTYIASYLRFWKARREAAIARREREQQQLVDPRQLPENGIGSCCAGGFAGVDPRVSFTSPGSGSSGDSHTSGASASFDIQLSTIHEFSEAKHSSSSLDQSSLERIEEGLTHATPSFVPPISLSKAIAPSGSRPPMSRGVPVAATAGLELRRNRERKEMVLK